MIDNPIRKEELELLFEKPSMRSRDKFYIALIWLLGARIGEIAKRVKTSAYRTEKAFLPHENQEAEFLVFTMFTEKKRKNQATMREVVVRMTPYSDPRKNQDTFTRVLIKGLTAIKGDSFIVPVTPRRVRQILARHSVRASSLCPHALIHSRCTHVKRYLGYDAQDLKNMRGWQDSRPADKYVHIGVRDLMMK